MPHVHVQLEGHLTKEALASALAAAEPGLVAHTRVGLVVDCRSMTGYDFSARTAFVDWNKRHRESVSRVAIVTDNTLWHMVISAMSLASRQDMKAFEDVEQATRWSSS